MSKEEDDKKVAAAKVEAEKEAAAKKPAAKEKVYRVVHPHPGVHPVLAGEQFDGDHIVTDDAELAISLTEYGCQVFDGDTAKHALGTGSEKEQARIEAARKWAFQK